MVVYLSKMATTMVGPRIKPELGVTVSPLPSKLSGTI